MTAVVVTADHRLRAGRTASAQALAPRSAPAPQVHRHRRTTTQWAYISRADGNGFVPAEAAVLPDATTADVRTRNGIAIRDTTVYETASTSATVLGRVARGDVLTVLAYSTTWAYVRSAGGHEGYHEPVGHHPLRRAAPPRPRRRRALHPRRRGHAGHGRRRHASTSTARPPRSGEYLGYVAYGTQVTVLDQNGTWALITPGRQQLRLLPAQRASRPTASLTDGTPATVTVDFLTVYRSASTSSAVLGTHQARRPGDGGRPQRHLGLCAQSAAATTASASSPALRPPRRCSPIRTTIPSSTWPPSSTPRRPSSRAPRRTAPTSPSPPARTSTSTSTIASTGWGYVGIGNQRGYMLLDHLNKNSYATLSGGSSGASVLVLQQALEKLRLL